MTDRYETRAVTHADDVSPAIIGNATLYLGDCLEVMRDKLPDASVDLTVTSPPYDNLRTYNGTLNDWTPEKWQAIIRELFRVTKQGGVVVWIVGDASRYESANKQTS